MTTKTKHHANAGRHERGVRRAARTFLAAVMRILLLAPLRLVRGVLWGVAEAADKMAESVRDAEHAIAPVCELPFHAEALRRLREADEQERRELLEELERATR